MHVCCGCFFADWFLIHPIRGGYARRPLPSLSPKKVPRQPSTRQSEKRQGTNSSMCLCIPTLFTHAYLDQQVQEQTCIHSHRTVRGATQNWRNNRREEAATSKPEGQDLRVSSENMADTQPSLGAEKSRYTATCLTYLRLMKNRPTQLVDANCKCQGLAQRHSY